MNEEQEERLVKALEGLSVGLGELNEIARTAVSKQWPEPRQPREAVISRIPSVEDRLKEKTGNTDGPIEAWLDEFEPEEIGPREQEYIERSKRSSSTKASPKAGR